MTKVLEIELHNNKLSGDMPTWLGKMDALNKFDVGHNKIKGTLPEEWKLASTLDTLAVDHVSRISHRLE